jgi:hypothetical protein
MYVWVCARVTIVPWESAAQHPKSYLPLVPPPRRAYCVIDKGAPGTDSEINRLPLRWVAHLVSTIQSCQAATGPNPSRFQLPAGSTLRIQPKT